jgi:NADH dehydrogenase
MAVRPRVVIVGSGFGGLNAARRLASAPVDVTVIDRDNYHGFWPLLYEVATAGLGTDDIARPIRAIYSPHPNLSVRVGTVTGIDFEAQNVEIDGRDLLRYDFLVLAAGSATTDFGIPGVAEHAFPLKTLPDAVRLRNHILSTFERADTETAGAPPSPGLLTIALVGGGATGVEMAGALAELVAFNLASDFRNLDLTRARVVLIEMADHLLPGFAKVSSDRALRTLSTKGVEVLLNTKLQKVTTDGVTFDDGSSLESETVVWTAGVRANPLTDAVPGDKGKGSTVPVEADLRVPGRPNVFVIGDMAAAAGRHGEQLPQLAQVAIQGGRRTADNIRRLLAGKPTRPFHYHNHGIMATIGRRSAVAELPGGIRFGGTAGWLAWLGVHLVFLIGFRNRVVVLVNWAWNYITWDRALRVILDEGSSTPTGQPRA